MDRGTWRAIVHGVAKSQTRLSDFTFTGLKRNKEVQYLPAVIHEKVLVAQSCPTRWNPMDYSPPGSSVHGILQARILEWVAIPFSKGSSWPKDQTQVSCIAGRFFTMWATRDEKLVTKTVLMQTHRESKFILLWNIETFRLRNLPQKPV